MDAPALRWGRASGVGGQSIGGGSTGLRQVGRCDELPDECICSIVITSGSSTNDDPVHDGTLYLT